MVGQRVGRRLLGAQTPDSGFGLSASDGIRWRCYDWAMPNLTVSLQRTRSQEEYRCAVCGASFAPIEDSGSRILSVKTGDQETVTAIMCGGCHSKWSAGTTVTLKVPPPA
jgi:DNA-directed RNA polymerase subunit RPC12/RpoP